MINKLSSPFQYFNTQFPEQCLFQHMDGDHDDIPIRFQAGPTRVVARFIKGVDKRATITKNWSNFFNEVKMKKGGVYAFVFRCSSTELRMVIYPA